MIAFNAPSLTKFGSNVLPGGTIIYDSSVVTDPDNYNNLKGYGVPLTEIADNLGNIMVKNVVALGALHAAIDLFTADTFLTTIRIALKSKKNMIQINEQAFELGAKTLESIL